MGGVIEITPLAFTKNIVSFTDNTLKDAFFCAYTFNPTYETDIDVMMQRIVSRLKVIITDDLPDAVDHMTIVIDSSYTKWNANQYGMDKIEKVANYTNIHSTDTGTVLSTYLMAQYPDSIMYADIKITAYTSNNNIYEKRVLEAVPFKNGYVTNCRGTFFVNFNMGVTFNGSDWNTWSDYNF